MLFACSKERTVKHHTVCEIDLFVFVLTGGIVNVMPLLFSQISHNKTQVNVVLYHILLPADF